MNENLVLNHIRKVRAGSSKAYRKALHRRTDSFRDYELIDNEPILIQSPENEGIEKHYQLIDDCIIEEADKLITNKQKMELNTSSLCEAVSYVSRNSHHYHGMQVSLLIICPLDFSIDIKRVMLSGNLEFSEIRHKNLKDKVLVLNLADWEYAAYSSIGGITEEQFVSIFNIRSYNKYSSYLIQN